MTHDQEELQALHRKQEKQRRQLERSSRQVRRQEVATARKAAKLEVDRVRFLQQTMITRLDRAKYAANEIATALKRVVQDYVDVNAMRPEDIGWAGDLRDRMNVMPDSLTPKPVRNPSHARVRQALRKAIANPSNHAWSTKKFGAGSHVLGMFAGEPGVALGFSLGKEPQAYDDSEHVGISFGPDFAYTTGSEASDGTTASEHIRARLFRKLGLVRYRMDATKVISAAMQSALRDLNASKELNIHWHVPLETWGRPNQDGVVGDPESGYASGIYFGVYRATRADTKEQDTRIIIGYWGLLGMRMEEVRAASYDAFDVTETNVDDLGSSCLMNLLRSGDPMLEHREFSLRTADSTEVKEALLIKNSLGYFIVAEPVDRRREFEYYRVTGTLPKDLNEDYVGSTDLLHRYGGRTVYVDFVNKMIHYYTSGGSLRVRMFNDAAALNDYDYVDLHSRGIGLDQTAVVDALAFARSENSAKEYMFTDIDFEALGAWSRLKDDRALEPMLMVRKDVPDSFNLTIEMLRRSWETDRILYSLVLNYFRVFTQEKAVDLAKGYTFVGESDDDNLEALANRMAMPQLRVMLHAATLGERDFPTLEQAKAAVAKHQEGLENPKLDLKFDGLGRFADEHGAVQYFKTQPHQVRAIGMGVVADTGVWDVDMGGGKTLLSLLLFIHWIGLMRGKEVKPRTLIVMPDQLVTNYYREVKKFTRRDPLHPEAGSRMNVVTLRSRNAKMARAFTQAEIMESLAKAPDNTIIIASYSWISADPIRINTGEYRLNNTGERVYKYEYIFPRAEALIDKAGVNAVILDESHKIKNNGEGRGFAHKACMALSRVQYKFLMTGTFVSKTPQDVFNQVKFINPTMLGSIADFRKRYTTDTGAWNHETLKTLRRYIASRGVITMRREEWLYQMPKKEERFHFVDFKEETPVIFNIFKTLWEATNKEFPAEFAEILGGGKIRVDTASSDEESVADAEDALDSAEDELAEDQAIQDLNPSQVIDASTSVADKIVRATVSARLQALRALVTAPERFPAFTEAMAKVSGMLKFDVNALSRGPKDKKIVELVRGHFEATNNEYVPPMQQKDVPESKKVGKIAIVCDRVLIAKHVHRILEEAGINGVGYYDASHREDLEKFCDPNDTTFSVMCMVENSVREGVNGQAISRIIKVTVPWTTGDYDQVIARMFRLGQRKDVIVDNIICARSFEPAQLARLISRENVNRKVNSDFDTLEWMEEITINPDTAHPETGIIFERDLTSYQYGTDNEKRVVNLLQLHEEIYQYELRRSVAWQYSYMLHLSDSMEMMEREPNRYVYKHLDRRSEIRDSVPGASHPFGCPSEVNIAENPNLENQIVYVEAERRIGCLYLRSSRDASRLDFVRIRFYELEAWNECATGEDIAGCHDAYEPWPTHGIGLHEMAAPTPDTVEPEQIEQRNERELRGIGQTGFDATLRQRIVRELRQVASLEIDADLSTFLSKSVLSCDSKIVTVLRDMLAEGTFDAVLLQSAGVLHVYSTISGFTPVATDALDRIQTGMARAAAKLKDTYRAQEQARTGQPLPEPVAGLGTGDEVIPGPVIRNTKETEGYTVGFGDMEGKPTFMIPQHARNLVAGAPRTVPGFKRTGACMFYQVRSEAELKSLCDGVIRSGLQIQNLEMFTDPKFKFELARSIGESMPDQTSSLSLMTLFAQASTGVRLDYMSVEKTLLITAPTAGNKQALTDAGFRDMPPYLYCHVTRETASSVLGRLQNVRNRTTLASRVYSLIRVRPRTK